MPSVREGPLSLWDVKELPLLRPNAGGRSAWVTTIRILVAAGSRLLCYDRVGSSAAGDEASIGQSRTFTRAGHPIDNRWTGWGLWHRRHSSSCRLGIGCWPPNLRDLALGLFANTFTF